MATGSTRAEQETLFRWDDEERVLWGCTADPAVARRWRRRGYDVRVLGTVRGEARTWEIAVPATGRRGDWIRAMSAAVPSYAAVAVAGGDGDAPSCPRGASLGAQEGAEA